MDTRKWFKFNSIAQNPLEFIRCKIIVIYLVKVDLVLAFTIKLIHVKVERENSTES